MEKKKLKKNPKEYGIKIQRTEDISIIEITPAAESHFLPILLLIAGIISLVLGQMTFDSARLEQTLASIFGIVLTAVGAYAFWRSIERLSTIYTLWVDWLDETVALEKHSKGTAATGDNKIELGRIQEALVDEEQSIVNFLDVLGELLIYNKPHRVLYEESKDTQCLFLRGERASGTIEALNRVQGAWLKRFFENELIAPSENDDTDDNDTDEEEY